MSKWVLPKNNEELSLFKEYAYLISRIQNHNKISETGVNYFGRPSFMTDKLLNQLINEAKMKYDQEQLNKLDII